MTTVEMAPPVEGSLEAQPTAEQRASFAHRVMDGVLRVAEVVGPLPSGGYSSDHGEAHRGVSHFPEITNQDTTHWVGRFAVE